jgi:hypothetical protein
MTNRSEAQTAVPCVTSARASGVGGAGQTASRPGASDADDVCASTDHARTGFRRGQPATCPFTSGSGSASFRTLMPDGGPHVHASGSLADRGRSAGIARDTRRSRDKGQDALNRLSVSIAVRSSWEQIPFAPRIQSQSSGTGFEFPDVDARPREGKPTPARARVGPRHVRHEKSSLSR